jgi:hypothetical protein
MPTIHAADAAPQTHATVDTLETELATIKGKLPDQSHAMKDVGYHFANPVVRWAETKPATGEVLFGRDPFAPALGGPYHPRAQGQGGDLELKGTLGAVDNTLLS